MEKGIQIGNESLSKETLDMLILAIHQILESSAEEETKRKALDTLGKLSVVQNVAISHCSVKEIS